MERQKRLCGMTKETQPVIYFLSFPYKSQKLSCRLEKIGLSQGQKRPQLREPTLVTEDADPSLPSWIGR
jgi:hypothetical protein